MPALVVTFIHEPAAVNFRKPSTVPERQERTGFKSNVRVAAPHNKFSSLFTSHYTDPLIMHKPEPWRREIRKPKAEIRKKSENRNSKEAIEEEDAEEAEGGKQTRSGEYGTRNEGQLNAERGTIELGTRESRVNHG
jgi:hypothetical protein